MGRTLNTLDFTLSEWEEGSGVIMFVPQDSHSRNGLVQAGWVQGQGRQAQI